MSARRAGARPPISPSMPKGAWRDWSEPMDHAAAGPMPAFTAERTTQSIPNMKRSSASRSSVQTQTRFGLAPSSVTALMASGREFHGVLGFPPRRKTHIPFSRKSSDISLFIASWVSVIPDAAPALTNSLP